CAQIRHRTRHPRDGGGRRRARNSRRGPFYSGRHQGRSSVKRLLIIAGSDSGGGAGIQADIKTASAFGVYAMTAVTAVTAQNTKSVDAVHFVPAEIVAEQIAATLSDIGADAIKIG